MHALPLCLRFASFITCLHQHQEHFEWFSDEATWSSSSIFTDAQHIGIVEWSRTQA